MGDASNIQIPDIRASRTADVALAAQLKVTRELVLHILAELDATRDEPSWSAAGSAARANELLIEAIRHL